MTTNNTPDSGSSPRGRTLIADILSNSRKEAGSTTHGTGNHLRGLFSPNAARNQPEEPAADAREASEYQAPAEQALTPAGIYIDELLNQAYIERVTDVHLQADQPPRWRKDGDVVVVEDKPLNDKLIRQMLQHIMRKHEWEHFCENTDYDFSYAPDMERRYRVNAYETLEGVACTFRVLKSDILDFNNLRIPTVIRGLAELHRGLVLVTGVTGSGKTTTLATMIKHINATRKWHIITIEDPIEIVHTSIGSLVSQRELGRSAESFSTALRYALRQDPDLILVGELRDVESIRTAISAAETGHMVFATIHAGEAHLVVERILSYFTGNEFEQIKQKLASNLAGVVAQRLLPRIGGGMVPAFEILVGNSGVRRFIAEGRVRDLKLVMQNGSDGMQTFNMALLELLKEELVDVPTAMKYSDNQSQLRRMMKGGISGGDAAALIS